MSLFPTPPIYAGIDASENATHIARLRKSRKGWEVLHLKTFSSAEPVKPLDTGVVVAAFPSRETLVRTFELQVKKEKDLRAALDFQIEPLLPYTADKAIIQAQTIEKKGGSTLLTAFAIRLDHIQAFIDQLGNRGMEPERITSVPYALAALTTLFPQTTSAQFLVHEGDKETTCILVEKGKLLAARAFDSSRDLGKEIQKTILSFCSSHKTKAFETILLLGTHNEEIQAATEKTVLLPSTATLPVSQEELTRYGLAIGTALAAEGIDFRQKKFAYPHKWRRLKKPLIGCMALLTLLIGSLATFGHLVLKNQKQELENAYLSLLKAEGKSASTLPLRPEAYLSSLAEIEKEVRARPDTHPLHPDVPKVREFLAWLSSQKGIQIESLNYTLASRPDFGHKKERYKVKVDLEFSAKETGSANAFHDLLLAPNAFLDSKQNVQWTTGKGKYQTSFYLKDKTRYQQ
ncbi:MAG: hypothetical protein S4CHLAM2_17740 [Chlamydiales bacterium]|nr:hypothetical protein [Chlamydiales bacterium]